MYILLKLSKTRINASRGLHEASQEEEETRETYIGYFREGFPEEYHKFKSPHPLVTIINVVIMEGDFVHEN